MGAAILTVIVLAVVAMEMPRWSVLRALPLPVVWTYATALNGIWLMLLIGVRVAQRGINPAQRDGSPAPDVIEARVLQNTLEQTVLALLASGLVMLSHAPQAATLIALHAGCFFASRLCFWLGYRLPITALRVYGFALGFYSSVALYGYSVWFLLRAIHP